MTNPKNRPLRSAAWFGSSDKNGFMYRSWMKLETFTRPPVKPT